jgi:hypothetical protein
MEVTLERNMATSSPICTPFMLDQNLFAHTVVPPYALIQYPRFTAARQNGKLKK